MYNQGVSKKEAYWLLLSVILTIMMLLALNHTALDTTTTFSEEIFGIGVLWCCLIFFALNTFVIFGIKEYFRKYSNRFPNTVIFVSGSILILSIILLSL
ncbi:hypothetical protein [Imtechella halotolerans]|uniref:Uncharacterized protein n=1 Tax=Imtechella halotolerans K1 TaxID=946077 RepID=I0WHA4_9FLAO|nr:hypothetical protein [Imtechella halotolerans]EID75770.1 hypothetical protein W5A_06133 [Imtechella halotolerans K1]WMQ63402.1 hypothetical protein PT603_00160 [Imtechella halotolerans]